MAYYHHIFSYDKMTFVLTSAYGASSLLVSRASRSAAASFSQLEADRKVLERAHRPGSTGPVASNSPPSLLLLWQWHLQAIICGSRASRRTTLSLILSGVTGFATTMVTMVVGPSLRWSDGRGFARRGVAWHDYSSGRGPGRPCNARQSS